MKMAQGKIIITQEELDRQDLEFSKAQSLAFSLIQLNFHLNKKKIMKQPDFTAMTIFVLESIVKNLKNKEEGANK